MSEATANTTAEPSPAHGDVVVLTGMAGSGKGVALNALEDVGYYCVDNLPPELLPQLITLERQRFAEQPRRLAVSIDPCTTCCRRWTVFAPMALWCAPSSWTPATRPWCDASQKRAALTR